jgi:hypothetical protein
MKRRRFGQNTPFHLNAKAAKTCPFSYWFSICNVFNQVLNCNFDLKLMQFHPCQNPTAAL